MFDLNNSRTRSILKATIKTFSFCLVLSFLFSLMPVETSWAGEDPVADAMKFAAVLPKAAGSGRGDIEEATEAAISSVKGIVDLMKQAQALSAMLPPKKQMTPPEAAMLIAARTPDVSKITAAKKAEQKPAKTNAAIAPASKTAQKAAAKKAKTPLSDSKKLRWPVEGYIYSTFNATRGRRKHGAIDIVTQKGVPIAAAADGIVSVAASGGKGFSGYGKIVVINHGKGLYTLYAHCDRLLVKMGQRVKAGEYIATVGRTGRATTNHCHFEVRISGKKHDPLAYLPSRPDMVKANNYHSPKGKKR
jgi:murein DD-endopeptidase MepM/ murein hydrolase activator NlpD